MTIQIALAGNPNAGKTTIFNSFTGSAQHVGNWPGVTVEKKEGQLKGHNNVVVMDLPGIYSLSPYTLEEVVARNYLIDDRPNVIINIVDASNLERNLYLTTQLLELDIPVIVALNMIDVAEEHGDKIDVEKLSKRLGCMVIPASAIQNQKHENKSSNHKHIHYQHGHKVHNSLISSMRGLDALASKAVSLAEENWISTKSFKYSTDVENALNDIESIIEKADFDKNVSKRWISIKLFENDEKLVESLDLNKETINKIDCIREMCEEKLDDDSESIMTNERYLSIANLLKSVYKRTDRKKLSVSDKIDKIATNKWLALPIFFGVMWFIYWMSISTLGDFFIGWVETLFGWISAGIETLLVSLSASDWLLSLVIDGILGGFTSVFIFVPQLMILFFFISLLEDCGYMARVAFIMDKIFRKFGLSGKSFIPMLIGTGCSIPGVMASRTIENDKDRKMTIMLTPFIPCGAKLPVFAMFAAMLFSGDSWVGPSMYILGIGMVIVSGIILKSTKMFKGEPAPFVMELPPYRMPKLKGVGIHMWGKGKSFMIKAGTVIFIACGIIWFLQSFNFRLDLLGPEKIEQSILAAIGKMIAPVFKPLGFGNWMSAVASLTGLVAKEVVVATFGIIGSAMPVSFTQVSAYAFMVFTLFSAPCFAAIGAMKREFGSWKWTLRAIAYQTGVAYMLALLINQFGELIFKNSAATKPVFIESSLMEAASETDVMGYNIILIIFGSLLAFGLIIGVIGKINALKALKA
jgi:ferrous iron transport protein B